MDVNSNALPDMLPELIKVAFILATILVISSFLFIIYRLSHRPRQSLASERRYESIDKEGNLILGDLPSLQDDSQVFLSVVIPAFNESQRMSTMLSEAIDYLRGELDDTWEILIVDDGSADRTTSVALEWANEQIRQGKMQESQFRVCTLELNRGKGGAVTHGMKHHRGQYAIFADADGASRFADVSLLLKAARSIEKDGCSIAGGSRAHMVSTDAVVKRSPIRNLLMHGFHTFIRLLGVSHIKDTQCGFKLFSRQACEKIFTRVHIERYAFDVEVYLLAQMLDIPVEEVAITWHEVAGSKMNLVKDSLNMAWDLILMRVGYTTGLWSLHERCI